MTPRDPVGRMIPIPREILVPFLQEKSQVLANVSTEPLAEKKFLKDLSSKHSCLLRHKS